MSKYIAAIDLGTSKIACALGEKTSEGIRIVSYCQMPSKGVVRGEIVNLQNVIDVLNGVIDDIQKQSALKIDHVFVNVAGQNIKCETNSVKRTRNANQDLITQKEIDDLKKEMYRTRVNQGEQILHVIPQYYNIDDRMGETEPVGMDGKQVEAFYRIFICKSSAISNIKSVISRTGLVSDKMILQSVASSKAVLSDDEKEIGVAVVDIGGGTSDLLIYQDNIIRHATIIPFGGNSITEDIRKVCGLTLKQAELLKVRAGAAYSYFKEENKKVLIETIEGRSPKEISLKRLSQIIEARLREILATVRYEIDNAGYMDKIPAGLVITGGCSNIPLLTRLAERVTGLDIRLAQPGLNISNNSADNIYSPGVSTAVGLVLMGFEYYESSGNADTIGDNSDVEYKETLFEKDEIKSDNSAIGPDKEKTKKSKNNNRNNTNKETKEGSSTINKFFNTLFKDTDNGA